MKSRRSQTVFLPGVLLVFAILLGVTVATSSPARPAIAKQAPAAPAASAPNAPDPAPAASGWLVYKNIDPQPVCNEGLTGGLLGAIYYDRRDCGFGYVTVSETTPQSTVKLKLITGDESTVLDEQVLAWSSSNTAWTFDIMPEADWPTGLIYIRVTEVNGQTAPGGFGQVFIYLNQLGATVNIEGSDHKPGDPIDVSGEIFKIDQVSALTGEVHEPAGGAEFFLRLVDNEGAELWRSPTAFTASSPDGSFSATIPATATQDIELNAANRYRVDLAVQVVDATYDPPPVPPDLRGNWAAEIAGSAGLRLREEAPLPDGIELEASFVSAVGWVKPGETYPFRVFVRNYTGSPVTNVTVQLNNVPSSRYTRLQPSIGSTSAVPAQTATWQIASIPAATDSGPGIATLVVEARASTLAQDPEVVWKDLSSEATLTGGGVSAPLTSMTHGPKVIPPDSTFDTARFGDRPFAVVPVDYQDRKHEAGHTGELLAEKINDPAVPGSTFNLYQEMSLGQLFPHGTVPSADIASADFSVDWQGRFEGSDDEFPAFTVPEPQGACNGVTLGPATPSHGAPVVYPERIRNGWYQLPGDTQYYGTDRYSVGAVVGADQGIAPLFQIDDACGPPGKAVYDAAHIADPEIDYNDYDTDKDGVVDFFMMVFAGIGGNGASQTNTGTESPNIGPYDNIWPHSSSLEFYYTDEETKLTGYISDDQLKSLTDVPQCWQNNRYAQFEDCAGAGTGGAGDDDLPVYVRVGPYNVNPESAIDNASVISHEYGHSLGLPDFYSLGARATYGDWNLMATDLSQHMDVFSKQEMGWIVPQPLEPDSQATASGWRDSKFDTGRIHWQTPDGVPYTLGDDAGEQNIHNAEAYVAKLPRRRVIDEAKVQQGTEGTDTRLWWSIAGNDFGCPPNKGHNFDIYLPEFAQLEAGDQISVTFNSYWDIEWDYDYGFVMVSTLDETTGTFSDYVSVPSKKGYTTPAAVNPQANNCQATYGNGLTGTSGAYQDGNPVPERANDEYPDGPFLPDEYDLTPDLTDPTAPPNFPDVIGSQTVLRFSYATDPGLARPGWFIDDLKVWVNGEVIWGTTFDDAEDPHIFNGGCADEGTVANVCTAGWAYVNASAGSPADHAYYMEMRDRSGFDLDGKGESDRGGGPEFTPGMLLVITDETHGYGNTGAENYPAQSPVDENPQRSAQNPNLNDAAFNEGEFYTDTKPVGWVDNYREDADVATSVWRHAFDCLSFTVTSMTGDDVGPGTAPGNLEGTVDFTLGDGCSPFYYGSGPVPNDGPTAIAQARPATAGVGEPITFDGSTSFDDQLASDELLYSWDFQNDGTYDVIGDEPGESQQVDHAYSQAGTYTVKLRVREPGAGGLEGTTTIQVTVTGGTSTPTTTPTVLIGTPTATVPAGSATATVGAGTATATVLVGSATATIALPSVTVTIPLGTATVTVPAGTATVTVPAGTATGTVPAGTATATVAVSATATGPAGTATSTAPAGSATATVQATATGTPGGQMNLYLPVVRRDAVGED